jgi:hypothetical protein
VSPPCLKARKEQVAQQLGPRRAIIQDATVDVAVFALVFLAASWVFGRIP